MFSSKEEFIESFKTKLIQKYGETIQMAHISEEYEVLGEMVREEAGYNWRNCREQVIGKQKKQLIYFSMEFLMGKLMLSNMQNLGIYEVAKEGLADLGIDINDLLDQEPDAGLGNGGLGRLAACFLDSIASLGYPGHGNTIRYEYGFFRQKFVKGKQTELPDQWLSNGFVFEVRKPKHAVDVKFGGSAQSFLKANGEYGLKTVNAVCIRAVPYDVSIPGYKNGVANSLRLWSAEPSEDNIPTNMTFEEYLTTLKELCHGLYPDDSTEHGKILRLRQQYFLVSAGLQSCMRSHFRTHKTLLNMADYFVFQLNDTHPILAIPEAMRLMLDEYNMGWDESWGVVQKMFAYTNHTVMPEALEKWPVNYVQNLSPRIFMIIEEINRRLNIELSSRHIDPSSIYQMQIIKDNQIHMTNMAIYTGFSVNGVAKIHSDILTKFTFKDFYNYCPEKFNNKTNGVTHRRWLMYSNERLTNLISSKIGDDWKKDFSKIKDFEKFADDVETQNQMLDVKKQNKIDFSNFVKKTYNIEIDPNSIYDVQIKRLHAYKRQLLNILHIMDTYNQIVKNPNCIEAVPHTYIFGAKAAPSYVLAKKIIELILAVAKVINNDPVASKYIKIVFVENYGVSLSEKIIPAADISEQISTAGKEASGTSNMKLMMNGAITLGTLDGANIEIVDYAGRENAVIFGLTANEVEEHIRKSDYCVWDVYNNDPSLKDVTDLLLTGPWTEGDTNRFRIIFDEIMNKNDEFFVLADYKAYKEACKECEIFYLDKSRWAKAMIKNVANSGYFTSDRTIEEYNKDIWHLEKLETK